MRKEKEQFSEKCSIFPTQILYYKTFINVAETKCYFINNKIKYVHV